MLQVNWKVGNVVLPHLQVKVRLIITPVLRSRPKATLIKVHH
jgi:hypothetical protein